MNTGDKVTFILGLGAEKGEVIKINEKTVIVRLPNGKKVKRHIEKHDVRVYA